MGFSGGIGGRLIQQMEAVINMIDYGKKQGLKRQIFFVEQTGYDTHNDQAGDHARNLRELSLAMHKFQTALDSLNLSQEVTSFNLSDFGRSVSSNGDGTDYAWGGHYFVMGGAVKGGGLYGHMSDLTLGGDIDFARKGRLISDISTEQYLATLTSWFGVDASLQNILFPNLNKFATTNFGVNVGFMKP